MNYTVLLLVFCLCCNKNSRAYGFFFVAPGSRSGKSFVSDSYCENEYVLISAGFLSGFLNLPTRQRHDNVFYVPQNES